MAVFAVIAQEENAELTSAVKRVFPRKNYKFGPAQFVVSTKRYTPHGVTVALGGEDGNFGSMLVMEVTAYWGFHDDELWQWLRDQDAP